VRETKKGGDSGSEVGDGRKKQETKIKKASGWRHVQKGGGVGTRKKKKNLGLQKDDRILICGKNGNKKTLWVNGAKRIKKKNQDGLKKREEFNARFKRRIKMMGGGRAYSYSCR